MKPELKALTVRQPWAWLIFNGKDIENRTWHTKQRGTIAIHTSAKVDKRAYDWLVEEGHKLPPVEELVCGQIIGTVDIVDCVQEHPSPWKENGTWGFVLENAKQLEVGIPCKGKLGFWDCGHLFVAKDVVEFEVVGVDINRRGRGVEWIRVKVFFNGEVDDLLWMDYKDIKLNKEKFGEGCFKNRVEDFFEKETE